MAVYEELADLYDRAAKNLACKELRLFLSSQASRLRMFTEALAGPEFPQGRDYVEATRSLIDAICDMGPHRRTMDANILRINE